MAAPYFLRDLLSLEAVDHVCSDEHLLLISLDLTDWQALSPFLGLSEADEEVVLSERTVERQRIDVLRKWRAKFGTGATYRCVTFQPLMYKPSC